MSSQQALYSEIFITVMCDIKLFYYFVLINLGKTVLGESNGENGDSINSGERMKLIIDTDAGADDGVALLNVLGAEYLYEKVEVRLITTVSGNTHVGNVCRNVLKVLKTIRRLDIPVHRGMNQSLLVTPKSDDYFGEDGFGDFYFPDSPRDDLIRPEHAVTALIREVDSHPGELILLCLGPLTNIALALRLDPQFLDKLKEVYILGGSDSAVGNIKPGVEFNFFIDPEAALIVLKEAEKSGKILNLMPWETVFLRSTVDMDWRKNVLGSVISPQVDLINSAERLTLHGENWNSADTILSSIVIDSSIVESSGVYHADLELSGTHSRGALFIDYRKKTNLPKNIRLLQKINVDRYKRLLLGNLNTFVGLSNAASRL